MQKGWKMVKRVLIFLSLGFLTVAPTINENPKQVQAESYTVKYEVGKINNFINGVYDVPDLQHGINLDNNKLYLNFSNINFYNSSSATYNYLNDSLLFINLLNVYYASGQLRAVSYLVPIKDQIGAPFPFYNLKYIKEISISLNTYQATGYPVINYTIKYYDEFDDVTLTYSRDSGIMTNPNTEYNNGTHQNLSGLEFYFHTNINEFIYNTGVQDGYMDGLQDGYNDGYDDGKDDGLDEGYIEGLQAAEGEIWDTAYAEGSRDSFLAKFNEWIVPAIIIVLFGGGVLTVIQMRKRGRD